MNTHKYHGIQSHDPKFIIRKAIEKDALIVCEDISLNNTIEEAARGINIQRPFSIIDLVQHYNPHIKDVIFVQAKNGKTEQKYNSDPDFSNAEKGDLIWNDAFGLGKVKDITTKEIIIEFESVHSTCFFDGRYISNSPKPTFFYSDGKGNNYLTKRPKQEIDFFILKTGDRILVDKQAKAYFIAYNPNACFPVWVAHHKYKDGTYYNMELVAAGRVSVARIEED